MYITHKHRPGTAATRNTSKQCHVSLYVDVQLKQGTSRTWVDACECVLFTLTPMGPGTGIGTSTEPPISRIGSSPWAVVPP